MARLPDTVEALIVSDARQWALVARLEVLKTRRAGIEVQNAWRTSRGEFITYGERVFLGLADEMAAIATELEEMAAEMAARVSGAGGEDGGPVRLEVDLDRCEDCPAHYKGTCCRVWWGLHEADVAEDGRLVMFQPRGFVSEGAAPAWCPLRVGPVLLVGVEDGEEE